MKSINEKSYLGDVKQVPTSILLSYAFRVPYYLCVCCMLHATYTFHNTTIPLAAKQKGAIKTTSKRGIDKAY